MDISRRPRQRLLAGPVGEVSRRGFLRVAGVAGLGLALPSLAGCTSSDQAPTPGEPDVSGGSDTGRTSDTYLPIERLSREQRESSAANRLVLAHFFPVFPAIVDHVPPDDYWDDIWLPPGGTEGSIEHRPYGGLVRDRKWVGSGPESGWVDTLVERQNLQDDILLAIDAGLDGFTVELLSAGDPGSPQAEVVDNLYAAAQDLDDPYFRLVPMPDGTTPSTSTAQVCADYVAELLGRDVPTWLIDDIPVIAPFAPEAAPQRAGDGGPEAVDFWRDVLEQLASTRAQAPLLWPVYVATWDSSDQAGSFDPIVVGHGRWGEPLVAGFDSERATTGAVARSREEYGKPWMGFVMKQVDRPKAGLTWDSHGTRALATQWAAWIAAGDDCPVVHLPTWDDYSEGTQIAPSTTSGSAWADLTAIFCTWYKLGRQPDIVRDGLYLSSRRMIVGLDSNRFSGGQTDFPSLTGSAPQSNMVEVRVFATAPATLRVLINDEVRGEFELEAGMSSHDVDADLGLPSAELLRGGQVVARVAGPVTITDDLVADDRLYHCASSLRQENG